MSAPVTEEDKPAVISMIKRIVRLRKREHAQGRKSYVELDDAITSLQEYGAMKGWWKQEFDL